MSEAPIRHTPPRIYVWLVPSEEVQEQPGSWRIRKWDTAPFPEANFALASEMPERKCEWLQDIDGIYHTGCGGDLVYDAPLKDCGVVFCQRCGGKVNGHDHQDA